MPKIHRILLPVDSDAPESWLMALQFAEQINTASTPNVTDVVLLLHVKDNLRHTSLAGMMDGAHSKMLYDGKQLTLPSGAKLRMETKRKLSFGFSRPTTIIAFYANDEILEQVDGLRNLAGVVAVPEYLGYASEWKARWSPLVPGERREEPAAIIDDPVIEAAMKSLSRLINKSNGILVPRDKEWTQETLRILRNKGHSTDPANLKSWAIRHGWQVKAAGDLAKIATKIFDMKTKPSLAKIHDPQGKYERWQKGD